VLERQVGKGTITYIGAWLDPDLLKNLTASLLKRAGVQPILTNAPEGVEVCERTGDEKTVLILINHSTEPQHVVLSAEMTDLLGAQRARVSSVDLPKYGIAVLEK
jgi:beta-galactosidase